MVRQPNPSEVQRPRDPVSILGLPIVAVMFTLAATSVLAVYLATATLQCWRLDDRRVRVVQSAMLCRETPPLRLGSMEVYSPLAPLQWLNTFNQNTVRPYSFWSMRPRDKDRVKSAYAVWLWTWFGGWAVSAVIFLGTLAIFRLTYKEPRIQIYGTRFFAERDEVLGSGLVVGYKPSLRDRINQARRKRSNTIGR